MGCSYSYQNEMKEVNLETKCCGGYCSGCGKEGSCNVNINVNQETNNTTNTKSRTNTVKKVLIFFFIRTNINLLNTF
jgi:hypothetical protein